MGSEMCIRDRSEFAAILRALVRIISGRGLQSSSLLRSCGRPEALPHSNLVFQLRVHSLGISGFELGLHYCQLPGAEEVQPDRNSCPSVLTVPKMLDF